MTVSMTFATTFSWRHPCFPPAKSEPDAFAALLESGRLCMVRGRICNGKRPLTVKLAEVALALGQTVGHGPQRGRIDPEPDMAREIDLDVLRGIAGTQTAGLPVHDAVAARIDRGGRHRKVTGYRAAQFRKGLGRLARQQFVQPCRIGRRDVVGE